MKKLFIIFLAIFISACVNTNVIAEEHFICTHLYSNKLDFSVYDMSDIREVEFSNCPDIIKSIDGQCPRMMIITTVDEEVLKLTETQFQNYNCRKVEPEK